MIASLREVRALLVGAKKADQRDEILDLLSDDAYTRLVEVGGNGIEELSTKRLLFLCDQVIRGTEATDRRHVVPQQKQIGQLPLAFA